MRHLTLALALTWLGIAVSGCAGASNAAEAALTGGSPGSNPSCPTAETPPTVVTVKVKNALVGQIQQIATGGGGWTWIVSQDLVLHCSLSVSGGTASSVCTAYPASPYAYETAAP